MNKGGRGKEKEKKNQSDYKPGSVPQNVRCLPFIRACRCRHALSFYPPAYRSTRERIRASNPLPPVYANFQLPMCTARMSPHGWWALTPPSHPYLLSFQGRSRGEKTRRRFFSSALIRPHGRLPVKKRDALCCPDFPPASRHI